MRRIERTPEEEKKVRAAKNSSSKKYYDENKKKRRYTNNGIVGSRDKNDVKRKISFKVYYEQLAQKVQEIKLKRILRKMREQVVS